jgi:four helix bundle protein
MAGALPQLVGVLRHERLIAWQRADDLFLRLHRLARDRFPPDERFELASQLRRAAYSVPANIVEGMARRSSRARAHFLNVAEASLAETAYCVHVAHRLGYIDDETYRSYDAEIRQVFGPLTGLFRATTAEAQE